jgi:Uncharacterized protein conserved in bacteria (DUF2252)
MWGYTQLNFGNFVMLEHKLVFDIHDFDETYPVVPETGPLNTYPLAQCLREERGVGNEVNRELAMVVNRCYRKSIVNFAPVPFLAYDIIRCGWMKSLRFLIAPLGKTEKASKSG